MSLDKTFQSKRDQVQRSQGGKMLDVWRIRQESTLDRTECVRDKVVQDDVREAVGDQFT
jgi:hypothetical protein